MGHHHPFHGMARGERDYGHFHASPFGGRGGPSDRSFGGEGGFQGGHRGGPRGGRRRRLFDQAELQTILLALLAEQPRHGYDLIRAIEELTGGEYAPSPGIVYPALTFMEEQGLIAPAEAENTRKSYTLTPEGQQRVADDAEVIKALRARLASLAEAREKADPAPVRRAMHSLKSALLDRLSQDGAGRETVLAIADIIDEATRKIERIEP